MTKKATKGQDTFSPMTEIAQLPKVGGGLGGYDISLGFSHRYAVKIAFETLADTPESVKSDILKNIFEIFHEWQDEHGVYPPNAGGLFGLGSKEQESARDYCERISLAAALANEEPSLPEPWECCPFVTTQLGLFWKLMSEEYEPLKKYLKKDWSNYEKTIAVLIILTNKPDSEYQSSDCIEAALKLASFKLGTQEILIKKMKPDSEAAFNRRRQKTLKTKAKKEEKERKILSAYQECCAEFGEGSFPNKEVAARTGIPESTVCKYLRNAGFSRYKTH